MMDILITGGTGFVGTNVIKHFSKIGIPCRQLNLRDKLSENALDNASVILHLAGKAHDIANTLDPTSYYQINFELTKILFDEFLKSKVKSFIFMSSVKAVADTNPGLLSEEAEANPKTHYGKSKRMAEEYMLNIRLPEGKSLFILRPCMIHGPGNKGNLNLLYKIVSNGLPWPLGAFENKRSFLSIGNLNFILGELILRNDIESGVYNIADDEPVSTNELFFLIVNCLEKKNWNLKFPKPFIHSLFKVADFLKLPFNTNTLNKLTENYCVNNKKICDAIQKPLPIKAKDGLISTIQSFS